MVAQGGDSCVTDKAICILKTTTGNRRLKCIEDAIKVLQLNGASWADDIAARWDRQLTTYLVFGTIGESGFGRHVSYSLNNLTISFDEEKAGSYYTGSDTKKIENTLRNVSARLNLPEAGQLSDKQIRQLTQQALSEISNQMPKEIGSHGMIGTLKAKGTPRLVVKRLPALHS